MNKIKNHCFFCSEKIAQSAGSSFSRCGACDIIHDWLQDTDSLFLSWEIDDHTIGEAHVIVNKMQMRLHIFIKDDNGYHKCFNSNFEPINNLTAVDLKERFRKEHKMMAFR